MVLKKDYLLGVGVLIGLALVFMMLFFNNLFSKEVQYVIFATVGVIVLFYAFLITKAIYFSPEMFAYSMKPNLQKGEKIIYKEKNIRYNYAYNADITSSRADLVLTNERIILVPRSMDKLPGKARFQQSIFFNSIKAKSFDNGRNWFVKIVNPSDYIDDRRKVSSSNKYVTLECTSDVLRYNVFSFGDYYARLTLFTKNIPKVKKLICKYIG